jgi:PAS domain S-box-containing protein
MYDAKKADPGRRLLLSDAHYRDLFNSIHEGFFVGEIVRGGGRAVDFVFLEINEAFTHQTGLSPDAALGRRVSEVIPGVPADLIERYGAVVDRGEPTAFEVEIPALEHRLYEARAHPLGGERFAVLFLEITERKRIEKALEESRALLFAIVDSVDQMIWSTRPDGYHDFFNRRWYEYTGARAGSTYGDEWADLFHPDDRERTFVRWRHSLTTGEPYEIEYRLKHRSGAYRWVLGRAHPVRNEAGEIIRWMGTCTDIHEQKVFAEELEVAHKELNHRIKNIFAVVSGLITLSARQHPESRDFAGELRERIMALNEAHDYARPQGKDIGSGATILGLIRLLLKPYVLEGYERVEVGGDDAPLDHRATTPVSLAIHELATNAAKYGAFSVPGGHVRVRGELSGGRFTLYWRERGGPAVEEPERFGFGSRLLELTLRDQLNGELARDWQPDGLEVRVSVPADRLIAETQISAGS